MRCTKTLHSASPVLTSLLARHVRTQTLTYAICFCNAQAAAMVASWGDGGANAALTPAGAGTLAEGLNIWALNCLFGIVFGVPALPYGTSASGVGTAAAAHTSRATPSALQRVVFSFLKVNHLTAVVREWRHR
jgi:hypothetical protein